MFSFWVRDHVLRSYLSHFSNAHERGAWQAFTNCRVSPAITQMPRLTVLQLLSGKYRENIKSWTQPFTRSVVVVVVDEFTVSLRRVCVRPYMPPNSSYFSHDYTRTKKTLYRHLFITRSIFRVVIISSNDRTNLSKNGILGLLSNGTITRQTGQQQLSDV